MTLLTTYDIEKLEIAKKLLKEVEISEGFKTTDYHPDLYLGDALQAIDELLEAYYLEGYTSPKPPKYLYKVRPWHEKLTDRTFLLLSDISGALVISSVFSVCASLTFWGLSDIKAAFGNRQQPDFAAQSQIYRGVALASISTALGCGVVASVIKGDK
jgi:hypothetical protein